jgi:hypothetical protein
MPRNRVCGPSSAIRNERSARHETPTEEGLPTVKVATRRRLTTTRWIDHRHDPVPGAVR